MGERAFYEGIRLVKQSHERYMTAILSCDVFPGLDKTDPMSSPDEDLIPDRFGPNYYQYREPAAAQGKKFKELSGRNQEDLSSEDFDEIVTCCVDEIKEATNSN